MNSTDSADQYALDLSDNSYDWYHRSAIKARRYHRISEVAQLLGSALIPMSAIVFPGNTLIPAVLGTLVTVITGLRSAFHWQDDYLRFSEAREVVEAERRLFRTGAAPYDDPSTRSQILAKNVTKIEQKEMGSWLNIAQVRRKTEGGADQHPE
ncbi:DUF4231 domain-containing protein [Nocardia salmonicida]|uniref:DUF4231 domain-containing protein n=1 Tax=Nocardia salmonicida TaxID=53431 RepID=UPI003659DCF8